jgi:two-component system response regulator AtoC
VEYESVLVMTAAAPVQRHAIAFLRARGYACVVAASGDEALESLAHRSFRFSLLDLDLDGDDHELIIRRLNLQRGSPGPIVGLSADSPASPVLSPGVDALVDKLFSYEDLDRIITEVAAPRPRDPDAGSEVATDTISHEIDLWRSPRMRELRAILQDAAGVDVTVLVTGETGTGKDVVARAIHHLSSRRGGPFVKVNCAAVPRELLESELFGHERGAFTGAHKLKTGKFESAHRGTIFLDEIGDLHPSLQAKLLHVLQDGHFSRVGGKSSLKVDVRVIAATNQDLERAVAENRFREDLYYRLNVIQIDVPPLRERIEEIPAFVEYFVRVYAKLFRREGFAISPSVMDRLLQHRYPGNVRELENLIKRMIVLGDPLLARAIPGRRGTPPEPAAAPAQFNVDFSLKDIARRASLAAEREAIRKVLDQTGWNRVRAAKALHISYRALLYKMKRVDLRGAGMTSTASPQANDRMGGWTA